MLLFTDFQSKLRVPAFTPVKFIKKSTATALVLSVAPVDRKTKVPSGLPVKLPFWMPPDEPVVWKVADDTVVRVPSGIVPVEFTATEPNRFAPVPAVKLFVQLEIFAKSSV